MKNTILLIFLIFSAHSSFAGICRSLLETDQYTNEFISEVQNMDWHFFLKLKQIAEDERYPERGQLAQIEHEIKENIKSHPDRVWFYDKKIKALRLYMDRLERLLHNRTNVLEEDRFKIVKNDAKLSILFLLSKILPQENSPFSHRTHLGFKFRFSVLEVENKDLNQIVSEIRIQRAALNYIKLLTSRAQLGAPLSKALENYEQDLARLEQHYFTHGHSVTTQNKAQLFAMENAVYISSSQLVGVLSADATQNRLRNALGLKADIYIPTTLEGIQRDFSTAYEEKISSWVTAIEEGLEVFKKYFPAQPTD